MKNKKISVFTVSLLVMLQLLTLGTSAAELESSTAKSSYDDNVNWAYSESSNMLTGGTVEYYCYDKDHLITVDPDTIYVYNSEVAVFAPGVPAEDVFATIQAPYPDSEIVWAYHDATDRTEIFATAEGIRLLDEFLDASTPPNMRLDENGRHSSWLENDAIHMLSELGETHSTLEIEVSRLANVPQYTLYAYDATKTCRYIQGYIFSYSGSLYYVDYARLSNNNFDADGNLSFRSGTVNMVKLSGELSHSMYQAIENAQYRYVDYTYESTDSILDELTPDSDFSLVAFWVFYALLGFTVPGALLVMGILLSNSKKLGRPRYWYILSGIAALWILSAIALMLILLL